VSATVEKRTESQGPMVAGVDMRVVAHWFVNELDNNDRAWNGMSQKEQGIWAAAMARTLRRIVVASGDLIETLADAMTVSPTELVGKNRKHEYVIRRHVAMWYLYTHMARNVVKIARMFSCDHSTVLYSINRVQTLLEHGNPEAMLLAGMCVEATAKGRGGVASGQQERA
jgi:hypothetical protein